MKKFFIATFACAALASCYNNDTTIATNNEPIAFGNNFVENSVRANDPSYSKNDIESFKVYGTVENVVIFPGTLVEKNEADYGDAWTCDVQQYWIPGADYKFVGIVDGEVNGVTKTNLVSGMPTTVEYTADGATDLLVQTVAKTAKTDGTSNGFVEFEFAHLLSKVNFTVNNGSTGANGYSFVVKNITFNGNTAGVYDVESKAWDLTKFTTGNTFLGNERIVNGNPVKDIVVASGVASNELATEVLFLPGTYTISFTVDILCNGTVITSTNYPAQGSTYSHTLAAAHAYNFNVNVKVGELIQFTVTEQPAWVNGNTHDSNDGDTVNDYIPLS